MSPRDSRHALVAIACNVILFMARKTQSFVSGTVQTVYSTGADYETYFCTPGVGDDEEQQRLYVMYAIKSFGQPGHQGATLELRSISRLASPKADYGFTGEGRPLQGLEDQLAGASIERAMVCLFSREGKPLVDHDDADDFTFGVLSFWAGEKEHHYRLPSGKVSAAMLRNCKRESIEDDPIFVGRWDAFLPSDLVLYANRTVRVPSFRVALPYELERA